MRHPCAIAPSAVVTPPGDLDNLPERLLHEAVAQLLARHREGTGPVSGGARTHLSPFVGQRLRDRSAQCWRWRLLEAGDRGRAGDL